MYSTCISLELMEYHHWTSAINLAVIRVPASKNYCSPNARKLNLLARPVFSESIPGTHPLYNYFACVTGIGLLAHYKGTYLVAAILKASRFSIHQAHQARTCRVGSIWAVAATTTRKPVAASAALRRRHRKHHWHTWVISVPGRLQRLLRQSRSRVTFAHR